MNGKCITEIESELDVLFPPQKNLKIIFTVQKIRYTLLYILRIFRVYTKYPTGIFLRIEPFSHCVYPQIHHVRLWRILKINVSGYHFVMHCTYVDRILYYVRHPILFVEYWLDYV